jgi:hypothetical protein
VEYVESIICMAISRSLDSLYPVEWDPVTESGFGLGAAENTPLLVSTVNVKTGRSNQSRVTMNSSQIVVDMGDLPISTDRKARAPGEFPINCEYPADMLVTASTKDLYMHTAVSSVGSLNSPES